MFSCITLPGIVRLFVKGATKPRQYSHPKEPLQGSFYPGTPRLGYQDLLANFAAHTLVEAVGHEFQLLYCPLFLLAD